MAQALLPVRVSYAAIMPMWLQGARTRVSVPPWRKSVCQRLFQAGADFDVFGEAGEDGAAFGADAGGDDHAVGFDAAEFARGEVGDDDDFAVDQFFWLVELRDAGADLADFGADVDGELEQFVGADDALGGFDLADAHLDFDEIVDTDTLHAFGRGCRTCGSGGG